MYVPAGKGIEEVKPAEIGEEIYTINKHYTIEGDG